MTHPNLTHWDAVSADEPGVGHPQGRRRDLGTAAASSRAGALLAELPPGGCAAPRRTHADEGELFYILDGEGFSIQDDRTYAVGAGDCLLHRVREPTHTLVAGEGGLTYLAFGPRIAREAAAGPPEIGTPQARRPPTIIAVADVPPSEVHRGRFRHKVRRIGDALGSETTGMRHVRIAPGSFSAPHHCHGAEEELFVVLGGSGQVRLGEDRFDVRRGSVVARPPGTGIAHSFVAGDQGLEVLTWGTREPNDICFYPDSGKVYLCGVGVIGRIEPLDYWDGEE